MFRYFRFKNGHPDKRKTLYFFNDNAYKKEKPTDC